MMESSRILKWLQWSERVTDEGGEDPDESSRAEKLFVVCQVVAAAAAARPSSPSLSTLLQSVRMERER